MRAAGWPQRLLWLLFAAYAGYVGWAHVEGHRAAARGEPPLFTDFTPTYAGSLLLRTQPPENLYRPRQLYVAELEAARAAYDHRISEQQARIVGYAPWMYPPTFLAFIAPLAYMPYLMAYAAWIGATLVPYLLAMRRILDAPYALAAALAAPPVFYNLMYGQTGFLTAGLIGLGLAHLRGRPLLAGVLIGLASVKPHFGVLIPFALAAAGHWRAFGAAVASVAGLVLLSLRLFGDDPWFGFIGTMQFHFEGYQAGAYAWGAMTSVLSALKLGGVELASGWWLQGAVSLSVAALVLWQWRRWRYEPSRDGLLCALLCVGTLLVVPLAYVYDIVLMVPAAGWLWADLRRHGGSPWERLALLLSLSACLLLRPLPAVAGVGLVVLGEAVLFSLILRRLLAAPGGPPRPGSPARA